jgi:hypothetical protein
LVVVTIMPSASIETSLYRWVAWVGRLHHTVTATTAAIEVPNRARMKGLLCVCFGELFALNCYKHPSPRRPALLCPTSQKYAFSRYDRTSARIIFVGDQQETAVHVLASTCTDRCPLLAQSGVTTSGCVTDHKRDLLRPIDFDLVEALTVLCHARSVHGELLKLPHEEKIFCSLYAARRIAAALRRLACSAFERGRLLCSYCSFED